MGRNRSGRAWKRATIVAVVLAAGAGADGQPAAPDNGERAYLSANGLLNRGMYELAADEYRAFLAAAPGHEKAPVARYGLAVCLVRLKDYEGADKELERLRGAKSFQFAAEVGLLSAQCALAEGDFAGAASVAEGTVREFPQSAVADDAAAILAEARYRDGKYAAACEAAELLATKWPTSPVRGRAGLIWGLSEAALGSDRPAAERLEALAGGASDEVKWQAVLAAAQARHRLGEAGAALELYRQVLAGPPGDLTPRALLGVGALLRASGDLAGAGRALDRVGKEFGASDAAPEALMERGRVWLDEGNADRARECFVAAADGGGIAGDEAAFWTARCDLRGDDAGAAAARLGRAIGDFPESRIGAELRFDYAAALIRAGEDRDAARALEDFERIFPGHALLPEALEMHARAEHRLGDYGASLALCERLLELRPEGAGEIEFLAGENELLGGDLEAAARVYARVLGSRPGAELERKCAFRLGTVLYRLGRADEAEPLLARVTDGRKTAPEFTAALLCLGDSQFQKGRWAEAERTLSDYLALTEESADDALLKCGLSAARQGRAQDAVSRFDELLSRFPRSPLAVHAMFERGQALAALANAEGARLAFEAVLAREPEGPLAGPAESQLGNLAMAAGDSAAGARHYARAAESAGDESAEGEAAFQQGQALLSAGDFEGAAQVFARVVQAFPGHARQRAASAQRVVALRRGGEPEAALEAYEMVERSGGEPLEPSMRSAVLYERARALQELGRGDEAAEAYRAVIADGPGGLAVYAMVDLAALASDAGREDEAGALLARAAQEARSADLRSRTAYRLAASQYKQEKYADAARTLDQLIEGEDAGDLRESALRLRGQSRMAMGRATQAAADFARLTGEYPDSDGAATDLLGLGEALAAAGDWPGSEGALRAYLERFPTAELWFRARFGLGWARENQSRPQEAMADYASVVLGHQGPTAARAQFQTGECLFALKRYEEAVKELLKVDILYAYPEWSAAALYEAGRCFIQLNKAEEARAQFAAVGERYGETEWAKLASKELSRMGSAGTPGTGSKGAPPPRSDR